MVNIPQTLYFPGKTHANFPACTKEVLKSLQSLMIFAGLGPSLINKRFICLFSGSRNKQLMGELRNEGRHAIKEIEKLEILFRSQSLTLESSLLETPIKYKEKVLTQWPKNSKEFQIYLKQNSPFLQEEEKDKKVRFNVSHVSSVSFNCQNNGFRN